MSPLHFLKRTLLVSLALALAAGAVAPAGALARGHLDPTFGEGGELEVKNDLGEGRSLGQLAPTAGGPIYFTEDTYVCTHGRPPCRNREWLRRFDAGGRVDPSYQPGREVFPGPAHEVRLIADTDGLPVFAWDRAHRVHLRRLLPGGRIDRSFGSDGTVTLDCRCFIEGLEATPGGGLLLVASVRRQLDPEYEPEPVAFWVEKLRKDGSPDSSFGGDGVDRLETEAWTSAEAVEGADGSVFLSGRRRAAPDPGYFVSRLTPRGRLDRKFGRAAGAAIRDTYARTGRGWWEELTISPRGHGLTLFATIESRSLILGLGTEGTVDPSFGHGGVARLGLGFASAADAGGGRLFVTGYHHGGNWFAQLLDRDGDRDRRFGSLYLPDAGNEYGLWIYPDGPGRAIVFSPGESICRQDCSSDPRLYRLLD